MFNPEWQVEDLRPIVHTTIEVFSPQRVMFGSNFPVDKLYRSYGEYWAAYEALTEDFSESERNAMFSGNARSFYKLAIVIPA